MRFSQNIYIYQISGWYAGELYSTQPGQKTSPQNYMLADPLSICILEFALSVVLACWISVIQSDMELESFTQEVLGYRFGRLARKEWWVDG